MEDKSPPDSLHQDRDAEVADNCALRRSHRAHDIGRHAAIRQARMDRRDVNVRATPSAPSRQSTDEKFLGSAAGIGRQRRDQPAIGAGDEHAVNARMRIKRLRQPLLGGGLRVRA